MIDVAVRDSGLAAGRSGELTVALVNQGALDCVQVVFALALPETFVLLSGPSQVEAAVLRPGESKVLRLEVRPRREGRWALTSPNFVYFDGEGRVRRVRDFEAPIFVGPPREEKVEPPPELVVTILTREIPLAEWTSIRVRVESRNGAALERLWIRVSGRVRSDPEGSWREVPPPPPGSGADQVLQVRCLEAGDAVPVTFEARALDIHGREVSAAEPRTLRVGARAEATGEAEAKGTDVTRILMLCANPVGTTSLQVGPEARDLEDEIRRSQHRDRLLLRIRNAVRAEDVLRELLEVRPSILHFSGHGNADGSLVVENETGGGALISASSLGSLAALVEDTVECVVLNACYSVLEGRRMTAHIPYVIGMSRQIEDRHARQFTSGFYMALGAGEPIERAFRCGCQLIEMKSGRGHDIPQLLRRQASAGAA